MTEMGNILAPSGVGRMCRPKFLDDFFLVSDFAPAERFNEKSITSY
jgi:hypothetical protein